MFVKNGSASPVQVNIDGTNVIKTLSSGTLTLEINDTNLLKDTSSAAISVSSTSKLIVTYSATIKNGALTAAANNSVTITYSNDPFSSSTGTSDPDKEYAKTYYGVLVKIDLSDNKTLANAKFSLYTASTGGTALELVADTNGYHLKTSEDGSASTVTEFTSTNGQINIAGLDSTVTYYLEETEAPAGYNSLTSRVELLQNDISSTVTASIDASNVYTTTTGVTAIGNNQGTVLPETGGIGTKLFIIFGSFATIGACIFLITNKRMSKEEI